MEVCLRGENVPPRQETRFVPLRLTGNSPVFSPRGGISLQGFCFLDMFASFFNQLEAGI